MLRTAIYALKRLLHRHTGLYQVLYNLATFNLNYARQRCEASKYPSRFGGMWTDRDDFGKVLAARQRLGEVAPEVEATLTQWRDQGFITLPCCISREMVDNYLADIEGLKSRDQSPLLITTSDLNHPIAYTPQVEANHHSVRTVDDYFFSAASREILMFPPILDFLETVFERRPLLTQSLSFMHGSEQALHQDTAFVRMNAPMKLAAIWVALEDVIAGSGELRYYPGSHRWEGFLFSGKFKHWDEERDGQEQLDQWHQWIEREARERGCEAVSFLPRKGDVFIWHGALAHGGASITLAGSTRCSLVGHYCPEGVRPLYHYYKPGQRTLYNWRGYHYCSSYYRQGCER